MREIALEVFVGRAPREVLEFADMLLAYLGERALEAGLVVRRGPRTLHLSGAGATRYLAETGTHELVAARRGRNARKRWFVGVQAWSVQDPTHMLSLAEVRFETCRAGGAGGQHVNRTSSAVRAVHEPSGVAVRVESTRSQHRNRAAALRLLQQKLQEREQNECQARAARRRGVGMRFERGNAVRSYQVTRGRLVVTEDR